MEYFFSYATRLTQTVDWMFNSNHLFLLLVVAFIVVGLYFALHAKTGKGQKVTKLVLAGFMFVLEIGRIVWYYYEHSTLGGTFANFNWWWRISFQMCAIMCWTTIITLILSTILKKDNKVLTVLKNILFGAALIGGALTFIYPDFISEDMPLMHFVNLESLLVHAFLILVPLYFIKIGELKIRLKNIWMPALGFLMVGSLSMMASQISGQNFAYALRCGLLNDLGINLPFPWHLPLTFAIVFSLTTILYSVAEISFRHKNKNQITERHTVHNKNAYALYVVNMVIASIEGLALLLFIPLMFPSSPVLNLLGLFCLLPIIVTLVMIVVGYKVKLIAYSDNPKNELSRTKQITFAILLLICNLPLGIWFIAMLFKINK